MLLQLQLCPPNAAAFLNRRCLVVARCKMVVKSYSFVAVNKCSHMHVMRTLLDIDAIDSCVSVRFMYIGVVVRNKPAIGSEDGQWCNMYSNFSGYSSSSPYAI